MVKITFLITFHRIVKLSFGKTTTHKEACKSKRDNFKIQNLLRRKRRLRNLSLRHFKRKWHRKLKYSHKTFLQAPNQPNQLPTSSTSTSNMVTDQKSIQRLLRDQNSFRWKNLGRKEKGIRLSGRNSLNDPYFKIWNYFISNAC